MANGRGGARSGAGRPKGTPNKLTKAKKQTLTEMAGQYTESALATLAGIMQDTDAPAAARVTAANSLLDRGHGKPVQSVVNEGDGEAQPLNITIGVRDAVADVRITKPE